MMFDLINHTAKQLYGMTIQEAHARNICIRCQEPASWDESVLIHTVLTKELFHPPLWMSSVDSVIRKFGTKE